MRNPETKRSFGFLRRYAAEPELSSPTGVIREGAAGFPGLQSWGAVGAFCMVMRSLRLPVVMMQRSYRQDIDVECVFKIAEEQVLSWLRLPALPTALFAGGACAAAA